jgi:hypothetical protein
MELHEAEVLRTADRFSAEVEVAETCGFDFARVEAVGAVRLALVAVSGFVAWVLPAEYLEHVAVVALL